MVQHYRQLIAWQKALAMVTDVYSLTKSFPREEIYGLTNQMRRAAVSVPSNIAERSGRRTTGEFMQFLGHSYGSLCELETQIVIGVNLGFADPRDADVLLEQTAEVGRSINGLIASLPA